MNSTNAHFPSLSVRFSDFEDLVEIGYGKDCVVYRARWTSDSTSRTVAIKAYNKKSLSEVKQIRVEREAQRMHDVNAEHIQHVIGYHGCFGDSSRLCLVMEYCEKGDLLNKFLREGIIMQENRVINEVALPLLIALTELHKRALIHRDVKLDNIFLDEQGVAKLGDFGLMISTREEHAVQSVGTPEYMAPETCKLPSGQEIVSGTVDLRNVKEVDAKVDVWALGVVLYELLTGTSPFDNGDVQKLRQNIIDYRLRPLPEGLSHECRECVLSMLSYDPNRRPGAGDLLKHSWIRRYCQQRKTSAVQMRVVSDACFLQDAPLRSHSIVDSAGSIAAHNLQATRRVSENSATAFLSSTTKLTFDSDRRELRIGQLITRHLNISRKQRDARGRMRKLWSPPELTSYEDDIEM